MAEKNYFFLHPERTQMLFLSCLEKPRSLEEVSIIYKVPTTLFYRKNFLTDVVERGIFKLDYIGRKPYLYSLISDEFKGYFEVSLTMLPTSRELINAFLEDKNLLLPFFDSPYFRSLWKEEVLKTLSKHHFKEPLLLTSLFSSTILMLVNVVVGVEKYNLPFDVAKTALLTGTSYLITNKALPFNVSLAFFETIVKNLNEKDYPHFIVLKEGKVYKFSVKILEDFLNSFNKSFLESLTKVFKKHQIF
jgi:hypothetical protein